MSLFVLPRQAPIQGGNSFPGARLHFYASGSSTTRQTTYSDSDRTAAHANPVVADANGVFPAIWLDPSLTYRVRVATSSEVLIYDLDPYPGAMVDADSIGAALYPRTAAEIAAGITPVNYSLPPGTVTRYGTNSTPGTTDMTAALQSAVDVAYAAGGGAVFIPAGVYGITSVSRVWAGNISISIRGEGKAASVLQKIGGTTTPVLNFSGSTLADISLLMSDFGVYGNAKGHNGIDLTLLARMELQRLSIFTCDVGLNSAGALVFGVHECNINANNIGYKCRRVVSPSVRPNLVNFYGGTINGNSTHGVDLGDCAGVSFWGTDFEFNGTASNLATGAVNILDTVDNELTQSNISFNNCWFESNKGMTIECAAATGLDLTIRTCMLIGAEGGNVANVGAIQHLILESIVAGETGATITSNATRTSILGGVLHTYVDNSTTTRTNFRSSSGTTTFETPTATIGNVLIESTGALWFRERATGPSLTDAVGKFWVKNVTPQEVYFTDDQGYEWPITPRNKLIQITGNYTLLATDQWNTIVRTGSTAGVVLTIPASGAVVLPINSEVKVYNGGTNDMSISITADTLVSVPAGTTGTVTLAASGYATLHKILGAPSPTWIIEKAS